MRTRADVTVLQVDDSSFDRMMLSRAFKEGNLPYKLVSAKNGLEALELLRGSENQVPARGPCIILLDLNMPRMSGLSFLEELRGDPELKSSIVFAMSTSNHPEEIERCYEYGIAGFLDKDKVGSEYEQLISMIDKFINIIVFPNESSLYY